MMIGVFTIPTSLILSTAIFYVVRRHTHEQAPILLLAALNLLIVINLIWFTAHPCSWTHIFGVALRTCH
jgi:hypothetical protein